MDTCLFCKIIKGEIPCKKIYEDDSVLAFEDIHPQVKNHILFVPKNHMANINELEDKETLTKIYNAIKKVSKELGIDKSGYRVSVNNGLDAGQTVFHLHFHLLGGEKLSDKMA